MDREREIEGRRERRALGERREERGKRKEERGERHREGDKAKRGEWERERCLSPSPLSPFLSPFSLILSPRLPSNNVSIPLRPRPPRHTHPSLSLSPSSSPLPSLSLSPSLPSPSPLQGAHCPAFSVSLPPSLSLFSILLFDFTTTGW